DANRIRLDFQNWVWFVRKGWLAPSGLGAINDASWKDILTTEGQFDVYHFQSLTFSLAVGGALLASGFTDLANFTIPDSLLGVLGLSQVVYIAGKMVAPPSVRELNDLATATRAAEHEFTAAANRSTDAGAPAPPADLAEAIRRAGPDSYAAYIDKAKNLKIMFRAIFGPDVPDPLIQPAIPLSRCRHCERSEAIQGDVHGGCCCWIASSPFGLLAMTASSHLQIFRAHGRVGGEVGGRAGPHHVALFDHHVAVGKAKQR